MIFALVFANFAVMGDNVLYPVVYNIYGAFPEQVSLVNYIVSGPQFVIFVVSLFASRLIPRFTKKQVLVSGGVLFALTSILGVAVDNIYYIIAMRTLYGASVALINVAAVAFIAELYTDEKKRGWLMGFFNSIMAVFGIIASLASGVLGSADWKGAYRYYWLSVPMVLLFLFLLPNIKKTDATDSMDTPETAQKKEPYSGQFWLMIVIVAVVTLCFNIMANFSSTYLAENSLGDTATSGIASAICTLGSAVFSFLFGALYGKLKKHLLTLSSAMLVVSYVIMYWGRNLLLTFIALALVGGAYGMAMAFSYAHGIVLAPTRPDDAIGIATAAYAISGFLSTYAATGMMNLLGTEQITPTFIIPMMVCVVLTVIYPILSRKQ